MAASVREVFTFFHLLYKLSCFIKYSIFVFLNSFYNTQSVLCINEFFFIFSATEIKRNSRDKRLMTFCCKGSCIDNAVDFSSVNAIWIELHVMLIKGILKHNYIIGGRWKLHKRKVLKTGFSKRNLKGRELVNWAGKIKTNFLGNVNSGLRRKRNKREFGSLLLHFFLICYTI